MTREERDNAITILENEKKCVNRANKNDYCNRDCYNCELVKTDIEILTALDMAIQALEQSMPTMVYPQVDGITPTVVAQADGEKTCGNCRNEDTYHCAECENKSDYEQSQADGDLISRAELLKALETWDRFGVDDTNSLFRLDNLSLPHYVAYIHYDDVVKCIKGMPSVAIPSAEPKEEQWKDFALWVAKEIFVYEWEYNKDAFAEIACRKLAKLGIVRVKGDEWELVEPQERSENVT